MCATEAGTEAAKHLPDTDRLTYYELIFEYALNQVDNSKNISDYMSSFWILSKPNIDANESGRMVMSGRPVTKIKPNNNQE